MKSARNAYRGNHIPPHCEQSRDDGPGDDEIDVGGVESVPDALRAIGESAGVSMELPNPVERARCADPEYKINH